MKSYRHLYPRVCDWNNLYWAWCKARRGKRGHAPAASFEFDLEGNLCRLQYELESRTYRPGAYSSFYIYEPKRRLISAAPRLLAKLGLDKTCPYVVPCHAYRRLGSETRRWSACTSWHRMALLLCRSTYSTIGPTFQIDHTQPFHRRGPESAGDPLYLSSPPRPPCFRGSPWSVR